ncbi:MAG: M48 family metallopeptidase [Nanoarchaeota archaeon]
MSERISFEDQITKNKIKSFFLIGIISVFFLIIGYVISMLFDPSYFFIIMIISIIFTLGYTLISYYNSDKIALASVNAKPASQNLHRAFFIAAENMALASGLPMPHLYVMQSSEINAFASGRDPKHAVICMTSGALERLNKQELEGIIAHEMSHIANYDIRFMTLTAILIGMISIISEMFLRSLWLSNSDNDKGKSGAILLIIGLVFAILAPIAAQLVQLSISRKREFLADATGAKLTRYPQGLANALKKIKHEHLPLNEKRRFNHAIAPLFISDPFKKKIQNIFSTHPDINERIRRLEAM